VSCLSGEKSWLTQWSGSKRGDRNNAFFNAKLFAWKRTNKSSALLRKDGSLCADQVEIKGICAPLL
jgi:hypothetical protein